MGAIAPFNYATWVLRYPEFAGVGEALVNEYFTEATLYHANDGSGPVQIQDQQSLLLNMLTAHICQLYAPQRGAPTETGSPQLVGAIKSASEGSVSVQAGVDGATPTMAWFIQTKYGLSYWQATARYRSMRYRAPWPRNMNPWFGSGGGGGNYNGY